MSKNIAGEGVILGFGFSKPEELAYRIEANAERFHATPVFDAGVVPRGRRLHIGEGVWMHRCAGCDDFTLSYGNVGYLVEHAEHEASHAEVLAAGIAGYNVGILG
jgi:hypothetical protein